MGDETAAPDITRLPIRRNVALLSAAVAVQRLDAPAHLRRGNGGGAATTSTGDG